MILIYHCYGGSHASVTAAAIHLGLLPKDRLPTADELLAIPHFDRTPQRDLGSVYPLGYDDQGVLVCILSRKRAPDLVLRALGSLAGIYGEELRVVNALPALSVWTYLGGFLSRRLGWVRLGRPWVVWGVRRSFHRLGRLVEEVQAGKYDQLAN